MIPLSLRLIREQNRIYKCWMRFLWGWYGKEAPIVLMVHGFKPTRAECKSSFEMTAASFERLMRHLTDQGWRALTNNELHKMVDSCSWRNKCFHLTFDDIYDTVYTEAYPILKDLQIPFTVFITKELVDQPNYITSEHLMELSKDPLCSIGAHSVQHVVFRNLTEKEMEEQCENGMKADSFAFPYGRIIEVSNKNRRQIRQSGFSMAFSALEGTVRASWFTGKWFLPRVNVSESFVEKFTSEKRLKYKDCEGR